MNILSAKFANEFLDAVEVQTSNIGSVLIALPPHSENIEGGQEAYAAWISEGNTPAPYIAPAVDSIAAGERCIEQAGFTASRLVTMLDMVLQAREAGTLSSKTKLVALYTWMQTVKGMAKAGAPEFPPCKITFEDVVNE